MATREFIEKRIEGREKEIAKLNKKMERILKAKRSGWTNNPYYYNENDIKYTQRDIDTAQEMLKSYQEELKVITEKENSRNVPALTEFLEKWKEQTIEFMLEEFPKYQEAEKKFNDEDDERYEAQLHASREEREAIRDERRKLQRAFNERWSYITQFFHGDKSWEETMKRDIEIEKNRKYDNIIERTNEYIGQIIDASGLRVGINCDLNGVIVGERGKVNVTTIGAGGWNIQRYHFRVLIHKICE